MRQYKYNNNNSINSRTITRYFSTVANEDPAVPRTTNAAPNVSALHSPPLPSLRSDLSLFFVNLIPLLKKQFA